MKTLAIAAACLGLSLAAFADDLKTTAKKAEDETNEGLEKARRNTRKGAKKAEKETNEGLEKARKKTKKGAKNAEKEANEAAKKFRQKVGTEK
jgi:F0F1-type ATP synthase membrane subunit b/b'